MKLMTKDLERRMAKTPAGSTDGLGPSAPVLAKFFSPTGRGTWYATEGQQHESGDWLFFGYVVSPLGPDCDEYGYFSLSELQSVRLPFGLRIERDRHIAKGTTLADLLS